MKGVVSTQLAAPDLDGNPEPSAAALELSGGRRLGTRRLASVPIGFAPHLFFFSIDDGIPLLELPGAAYQGLQDLRRTMAHLSAGASMLVLAEGLLLRLYWTLLDGHSRQRSGDTLCSEILSMSDRTAQFAERVAGPLVRRFDPHLTVAVEVANEPAALVAEHQDSRDGSRVEWQSLGRAIETIADAIRAERAATLVTAGSHLAALPLLWQAARGLTAIDVHIEADIRMRWRNGCDDRGGTGGLPRGIRRGRDGMVMSKRPAAAGSRTWRVAALVASASLLSAAALYNGYSLVWRNGGAYTHPVNLPFRRLPPAGIGDAA